MLSNSKSNAGNQAVLAVLVLMVTACFAYAADVSLGWDAPTNNIDGTALSDLAGYRVYHGVQSQSYSDHIDVGNVTTARISNLESGITHFFAVTALNAAGNESDFSEELMVESLAPVTPQPTIRLSTSDTTVMEGSWRNLQVSLNAPPSGVVTVSVFSVTGDTDISAVVLSPLLFDASNWMSNRIVKMAAAQDDDALNGVARMHLASSGTASTNVTITERDDDTLGMAITTNALFVPEGRTSTFLVRLTAQPLSAVTVTVYRASGDSDITVSAGATLVFGPTTWMTGQKVTLKAAQDLDALAGVAMVQCSSAGLPPVSLAATEKDDDTIGVELSANSLSIIEGRTNSFSIRLNAQPSSTTTVTVTRVSGDRYIGVMSGAALLFSRQNWSSFQTVTLVAIQDPEKTDRTAYFECSPIGGCASTLVATSLDPVVMSMDQMLKNGLVSTWCLDEGNGTVTADAVGTNRGVVSGAAWSTGHTGTALTFDGINDRVDMGSFDPSAEAITISAWIQWRGPSSQNQTILAKGDAATSKWRWLFQVNSTGKLVFQGSDGAVASPAAVTSNTWAHVAVTKANGQVSFFINGVQVGTNTLAFGTAVSGLVTIGGLNSTKSSQCFNGALDELRLYNRALGLNEVAALTSGGSMLGVFLPDAATMPEDSDLNGLPDAWEVFQLGGLGMLGMGAQDDTDGDGSPNSGEYTAGTDPFDWLSRPTLQIDRVSGQYQVSFKAAQASGAGYEGKTRFYTLEHCDDLASGVWNVVPGEDAIAGQDQTVRHVGADSEGGSGFYRFSVSLL